MRLAQLRLGEAETIFRDIVAADPNFIAAQRNLARTYLAMGRPVDAQTVLLALARKAPQDAGALMALADADTANGDFDGAAQQLQAAAKLVPNDPAPGFALVQLYAARRQWDKALAAANDLGERFTGERTVIELIASVRANSATWSALQPSICR